MAQVRCKFMCTEVSKRTGWGDAKFHYAAKFSVVTSGSEENKLFFASTPSGTLEVSTLAADSFQVGKEYYIDLTEVES